MAVDWTNTTTDLNGNTFLGSDTVNNLDLFSTKVGSFGDPVNLNHTGAAYDGHFYYDGELCEPGDPVEDSALNHKAWRFVNTDPLSAGSDSNDVSVIGTGTLRFNATTPISGYPNGLRIESSKKWYLEGDFSYQITYDLQYTSGDALGIVLEVYAGVSAAAGIMRYQTPTADTFQRYTKNGIETKSDVVEAASSGSTWGGLRIVKSGSTIAFYYSDGVDPYTQLGSTLAGGAGADASPFKNTVYVRVLLTGDGSGVGYADVTSALLVGGDYSADAGWAREATSATRGDSEMPTNVAAVCTSESLDLIDADNDLLWMRFTRNASNAFPDVTDDPAPIETKWLNGLLLTAVPVADGSSQDHFGAVAVNFSLDEIKCHRSDTDRSYGANDDETSGNPEFALADGGIVQRNASLDYFTGSSLRALTQSAVKSVTLLTDYVYMYRAFANKNKIELYKEKINYLLDTPQVCSSTNTGTFKSIRFLENGDLVYLDQNTLYYVDYSTWSTAFGSTFGITNSLALPDARSYFSQYATIEYNSYVYIIGVTAPGVYKIDPVLATSVLEYGSEGSGATYEILPEADEIVTFCQDTIGSDIYLVTVYLSGSTFYCCAVDLANNTLTPTEEINDFISGTPVAVDG